MSGKAASKAKYLERMYQCLDEFDRALLVGCDNVGSKQFQEIRRALRPQSTILMGKNTLMKKIIRMYSDEKESTQWTPILEHLKLNVGIIFTKGDLNDLKAEIEKYKVGAPARVGLMAPKDVTIDKGSTGMDPSQTSFFQALNIPTKINKGTIEIVNDVHIIKEGTRVGGSEATLLAKLNIKPFAYGLIPVMVFDQDSVYSPKVLDITDDLLDAQVASAISQITHLSLGANYPTEPAVPQYFGNAFKNVLAVAAETKYSFPQAEKMLEYLEDPEAFMEKMGPVAAAAAPAAAAPSAAKEEAKEEAKKEEEEEEEDEDIGMGGLFG